MSNDGWGITDDDGPVVPPISPEGINRAINIGDNILSRFTPAMDIPGVKSFKLGAFALDKAGKTAFCIDETVPRPIYFFDAENKAKIAIDLLPPKLREGIHLINLMTAKEVALPNGDFDKDIAVNYFVETLRGLVNMRLTSGTVVVDSLSVIWAWIQFWFAHSPDIKRMDDGKPYRFEYGRPNARFIEIGELLQRLEMNLICTMKTKAKVNSDGSDAGYNIMECQKHTGYFLEFYGELERIAKRRVFIVKGTNYGDLDGFKIDDPTFGKIRDLISKETGLQFVS